MGPEGKIICVAVHFSGFLFVCLFSFVYRISFKETDIDLIFYSFTGRNSFMCGRDEKMGLEE